MRQSGGEVLIYKRDRSLGGKEVVVGKREDVSSSSRTSTPLSSENADYYYQSKRNTRNASSRTRRKKEELPKWWPQLVSQAPVEVENKEEYQKLANHYIQGWCVCSLTLHDRPSAVRKECLCLCSICYVLKY